MKDSTVMRRLPMRVTAHRGIDSKNPHSYIAVIISLGRVD